MDKIWFKCVKFASLPCKATVKTSWTKARTSHSSGECATVFSSHFLLNRLSFRISQSCRKKREFVIHLLTRINFIPRKCSFGTTVTLFHPSWKWLTASVFQPTPVGLNQFVRITVIKDPVIINHTRIQD